MSDVSLLLWDLFDQLRRHGLPLGIDDYMRLIRCLKAGFGFPDRQALARLCSVLWVKSHDDQVIFDFLFRQTMSAAPISTRELERDMAPADEPVNLPSLEPVEPPGPDEPPPEDQLQGGTSLIDLPLDEMDGFAASPNELRLGRYLRVRDHFPVTHREMRQTWRSVRRIVREGPRTEFDQRATINDVARNGFLLDVVWRAPAVNKAALTLLIDQGGSMVPFGPLADMILETASRGGRLSRINCFYFHNLPDQHLYLDPGMNEAVKVKQVIRDGRANGMIVFSDAGAARGNHRPQRILQTLQLIDELSQAVRCLLWLNPMPRHRWRDTSAERISQAIPMYAFQRGDMRRARKVLLGKRTEPRPTTPA